jgi:predicted negative regulator of RcsB-dependent stress response
LVAVGIAGVGFYRGWFQLSSDNEDHKSSVTFSVDENKVRKDEAKAEEKIKDFGQTVKEKTGNQTGKSEEPKRQP